jgi:hypothetical protein
MIGNPLKSLTPNSCTKTTGLCGAMSRVGWGSNLQMMIFLEVSDCEDYKSKVETKLVQQVFIFCQPFGHMLVGQTFPGAKVSWILPKITDHLDRTCTAIFCEQLYFSVVLYL